MHEVQVRCGTQIRAARALLQWEQADLARAAGVSLPTVHRMETLGPQRCTLPNLLKVQEALVRAGVEFLGEGGSLGVRLSGPGLQPSGPELAPPDGSC
jgi:DNA-binding XRE family transcriptional regulator